MTAIRWALLALLALCPLSSAAAAEAAKEIVVTGEAAIVDGDVPAAKEKAKDVALREAVHQAVGAQVTSFSEMEDFTLVRDLVFTQTSGYVSSYEVVGEKVDQEAGLVSTTCRVKVAQGAIDKDAAAVAALLALKGQKRLLVSVEQSSVTSAGGAAVTVGGGQFENTLREAFRMDGFTILEPHLVAGKLKSKGGVQALATPREASELGDVLGADVVIYGHAIGSDSTTETYGTKSFSSTVRVSLSVVSPASGEVITETSHSVTRSSPLEAAQAQAVAMKAAADASCKALRARLYEAWRRQVGGSQSVVFEVSGVGDFKAFSALKAALANVRSVKAVSSSRLHEGKASYQLEVAGTAQQVAAELSRVSAGGRGLKILGVFPTRISAERQ